MAPSALLLGVLLLPALLCVHAFDEGSKLHVVYGSGTKVSGVSTDGMTYESLQEAWDDVLGAGRENAGTWYNRALDHWEHQPATVGGVLSGHAHLSDVDVRDSKKFIQDAYHIARGTYRWLEVYGNSLSVLEVGAGIGRVTKKLLLPTFGTVHVTEPTHHLLEQAIEEVSVVAGDLNKEASFEMVALQSMFWTPKSYDVVWAQWCLLYLTDYDLAGALWHIKRALKPGGILFVKENVASAETGFVVHRGEGTVTRSEQLFEAAFEAAGLQIAHEASQTEFDEGLYEVRMWALKDKDDEGVHVEL